MGRVCHQILLNKAYGAAGGDFRKFIIPPLSDVGRRLPGRSGARVGTDVVERTGLGRLIFGPLTKTGRSGARVNYRRSRSNCSVT